jgi:hypothetical protein
MPKNGGGLDASICMTRLALRNGIYMYTHINIDLMPLNLFHDQKDNRKKEQRSEAAWVPIRHPMGK